MSLLKTSGTQLRYRSLVAVFAATLVAVVAASGLASAQSDDARPLAAVENVRILAVGDDFVTVAWDPPSVGASQPAPTGYEIIYRLISSDPASDPSYDSTEYGYRAEADADRFTIPQLVNGSWYKIRVVPVYSNRRRLVAEERYVTVRVGDVKVVQTGGVQTGDLEVEDQLPNAPKELEVVSELFGSVSIVWEPPEDDSRAPVTGYEIWHRKVSRGAGDDSEDDLTFVGTVDSDIREFALAGLTNTQPYAVLVAAVNEHGRGLFASTLGIPNRNVMDPLNLIARYDLATLYSLGEDVWEVWVCDVQDGVLRVNLEEATRALNRHIVPYFNWLSGGMYNPRFISGGSVKADSVQTASSGIRGCRDAVTASASADSGANGALIVFDKQNSINTGSFGLSLNVLPGVTERAEKPVFPDNLRNVQVIGTTVVPLFSYCSNCTRGFGLVVNYYDSWLVAHEMGHALGFPHSFGGYREISSGLLAGSVDEYDNPMDIMSGSFEGLEDFVASETGLIVGTIAVNRYAAGWIDEDDVIVHDSGPAVHLMSPPGVKGKQLLALPVEFGAFVALGARVSAGYDSGIPAEGVEVYLVDQSPEVCGNRLDYLCSGASRRIRPVPPAPTVGGLDELLDHVYGPGEGVTTQGYRIEVISRVGDRFKVWVGRPYSGTFADDEGNTHEAGIEKLVSLGITDGCDPELRLYCPTEPITRAEMAEFLIKAVEGAAPAPAPRGAAPRFSDVTESSPRRAYIERLAELGITLGRGDGTFAPDSPVTRAHMALFFTRAFNTLTAVGDPAGVFADVPADSPQAGAIEAMYRAGVTAGCASEDGLRYCPADPVRRDQMASFLARVLN